MNSLFRKTTEFLIFSAVFFLFSCSKINKNSQNVQNLIQQDSAIIYDDFDFFDFISKIESGEIIPEPPHEVAEDYGFVQLEIPDEDTLEIKDEYFLTRISDIYYNFDAYKDKTIIIEGLFTYFVNFENMDVKVPAIYRVVPGEDGEETWGGFLLKWNDILPEDNDWIRVEGTLEIEHEDNYDNLYLKANKLEVMKTHGMERVLN